MNKHFLNSLLLGTILVMAVSSCADKGIPKKDKNRTREEVDLSYSDDLSKYRPVIAKASDSSSLNSDEVIQNEAIRSTFEISEQLDAVLDSVVVRNQASATVSGYTILVYSGNSERDAGRVRNRLFDVLPAMEAKIQYKLPTYFVKIGQFHQLIEAQSLYQKIRKYYPTATVVPEQFKLQK